MHLGSAMKLRHQLVLLAFAITLISGIAWSANHYYGKYQAERKRAEDAEHSLSTANATITDMQTRQRDVAALDAKYTRELADAQNTISNLRRDVDSGAKRLRVSATCGNVRKTSSATGMDAAATARPTDSAQRDYFTLRERIETSRKMIAGLQEYINTQCLK